MILRPAYETTLRHGDHALTLRASLRAAAALDNLPGGIEGAWDATMRLTYSGIRAVILATATDKTGAVFLFASLSGKPLASFLSLAQAACLEILLNIIPQDEADVTQNHAPADAVPFSDHLSNLFRFGTAVMGWSPVEVWQASIMELHGAAVAYHDLHNPDATKSTSRGSASDYDPSIVQSDDLGIDPAFDREGLRALKARHNA